MSSQKRQTDSSTDTPSPDIAFLSATEMASAITTHKLSSTAVLEAHFAQIDRVNPTLNAIVIMDRDAARKRAHEADEALAKGERWGALHGVPFALKDTHAVKGMRTTAGFPPLANHIPDEDSPVVARLRQAGAVLFGRTNVPTMLADFQSSNPIFGRTNNPWNTTRTPGGSSGGAAASVASGMSPFDIGTDLSASVRLPAHFCGVYGLKPTEHRVPVSGAVPSEPGKPHTVRVMSCIGPIARSIDDLSLLFEIIAGPDCGDTDVPPVQFRPIVAAELKTLKLAFAPSFPGFPVANFIRYRVESLVQALRQSGATVKQALPDIDFDEDLIKASRLIGMMIGAVQDDERPTPLPDYFEALDRRDHSIAKWERFFDEWDALICPAAMVTAFKHCEPGMQIEVDGRAAHYGMVSAYGTIFNYSGHPALTIPCGSDTDGLPIGVQIVGKRWGEAKLLAVAKAVSQATSGFQRPPGY